MSPSSQRLSTSQPRQRSRRRLYIPYPTISRRVLIPRFSVLFPSRLPRRKGWESGKCIELEINIPRTPDQVEWKGPADTVGDCHRSLRIQANRAAGIAGVANHEVSSSIKGGIGGQKVQPLVGSPVLRSPQPGLEVVIPSRPSCSGLTDEPQAKKGSNQGLQPRQPNDPNTSASRQQKTSIHLSPPYQGMGKSKKLVEKAYKKQQLRQSLCAPATITITTSKLKGTLNVKENIKPLNPPTHRNKPVRGKDIENVQRVYAANTASTTLATCTGPGRWDFMVDKGEEKTGKEERRMGGHRGGKNIEHVRKVYLMKNKFKDCNGSVCAGTISGNVKAWA